MKPIRIAQIMGKWIGGGVESVVMNYYKNIDRTKIQFDFICDNDSTDIPYKEIESLGGRIILIPPYQKIFKYQKELQKILKENKYQIIHSHINTLSIFPLYAAKKAGVPIRIAHSHSTTNKKELKKNLMKQILRPFSKIYATDYFCCSEYAGRWLFGNKEYNKGNVYLLNNAIDLDKFKYNKNIRNKVRKELNIKDNTLVLGHIGRFVPQKNHTFLIDIYKEIYKKNKDSILLLIGQGPLQEEIKCKAKALHIEDNIIFLNQRNDVDRLYQAFDIFLLPSLYEGLGMVLIEAQASGLPCIASTEVPKISNVTGLVKFLNLDDNLNEWVNCIFDNYKKNKRKSNLAVLKNKGYEITTEADNLKNKYLNCIECGEKNDCRCKKRKGKRKSII